MKKTKKEKESSKDKIKKEKNKKNISPNKEDELNNLKIYKYPKKNSKKSITKKEIKELLNLTDDNENDNKNTNIEKTSSSEISKVKNKNSEKQNLTKEEENIFIYNYNNYESEESNLSYDSASEKNDENEYKKNKKQTEPKNIDIIFKESNLEEKKETETEKTLLNNNSTINYEAVFNIGKNIQKEKEKENMEIGKLCNGFIDNKLVTVIDDKLYYNGFQYNKFSGRYIKKEYQKGNIIQFRCKNHRKDERARRGMGNFCNAEIILEINNQNNNNEQKFKFIKDHSLDCKNFEIVNPKIKTEINKWEEFKDKCYNFLENTNIYDNKSLIKEFHNIFEKGEYNFTFNEKKLVNMIKHWKRNSIKYSQYSIFESNNIINKEEEIFLREYKYFYSYDEKNSRSILNKYAIWIDDLNISHLRVAKHIFIDGTWYKPNGYEQILIILYKDIITKEKIPGCYIIMNNKKYEIYKEIFLALINILTQNHIYNLDFETITTDVELALIKAVNAAFPMVRHFNCYFHYKQDLIRKFKKAYIRENPKKKKLMRVK